MKVCWACENPFPCAEHGDAPPDGYDFGGPEGRITPARLHDVIGCPVQDAYRELETAARGISADLYRRGAADHGRAGDADALIAALAALDKAKVAQPDA